MIVILNNLILNFLIVTESFWILHDKNTVYLKPLQAIGQHMFCICTSHIAFELYCSVSDSSDSLATRLKNCLDLAYLKLA